MDDRLRRGGIGGNGAAHPDSAATLTAGLDSLVVFGVGRSLSVAETADQLANLFDAHHYTDGFAFIRPGTPTNNTDDRRAGYSSDDPGHQRSFDLEVAGTPGLDDNNALHTGTALGLRFDRILPRSAASSAGSSATAATCAA